MPDSWVINASPVILLAKVGLMGHVTSFTAKLVVPQPVADEILGTSGDDDATRWLNSAGRQFVQPAVPEFPALASYDIGRGERAVLSWALAHPGFVAVMDDRLARAVATSLGIRVVGTVGVVCRLRMAGLIPEAKPHLLRIRDAGGYISDELLRKALRTVGETI